MDGTQIDLMKLNPKGLFGVYGLWYQPWWQNGWVYAVIIGLLLVILFYFFMKWYRRGKKLNFQQKALQELHRLKSQTHASQEALHESYFRLTMIIKNYLSSRYGIALLDKTDIQIVSMLDGIVSQNVLSLLQEFFDRSFRIKFAYDAVSETMLLADIDMLQTIIVEMARQVETTGKS